MKTEKKMTKHDAINDIFTSLENTTSRISKEKILKTHVDNSLLQRVIFLALDPYTQFFIRKIPLFHANTRGSRSLHEALDELEKLSSRTITGNAAIAHLRNVLESLSPNDAQVVVRVVEKDLRCGVSEATVNKIWKNFIPSYPVMLASGYEEKLMKLMKYPAFVQLKLDGMRFNALVDKHRQTVVFRSRNGKVLNLLGNLEQEFLKLSAPFTENVMFDGELTVRDETGIMNRQKGNGILNKAVKDTISDAEARMVHATIWDVVPLAKFSTGVDSTSYAIRFRMLQQLKYPQKISLIETQLVNNEIEANEMFQQYFNKGEEGIILKNPEGFWEDKRVKHQIKFKGELECDLVCVDWQEGTGKNKGKLGALVLESADGFVKVNVGSGFTDEQRDKYTKMNTLGKIVTVKYNARIRDKNTNVESLFLPVFLEVREDKFTADSINSIA
jgi:ATP-dependent DNA ligase